MGQLHEQELQKFELDGQTRLQGPILTMRISDVAYVLTIEPPLKRIGPFKFEKIVPISEMIPTRGGIPQKITKNSIY